MELLTTPEMRRLIRQAWWVLGAYALIRFIYLVGFEWQAYRRESVELDFLIPFSLLGFIILVVSSIRFVRLALKRVFKPALIYALILSTFILNSFFDDKIASLKMEIKAHVFASNPHLCPTPHVWGQRASICYRYQIEQTYGEREKLVFNPGDEMSMSPREWPDEIKQMFGIRPDDDDLCHVRKTRRIVDHVYLISDDCWNKST